MIARKTQKIIYNILILCFLIGGATYVCSRFIHLGNIEYTDNAQVKQHITPINTRVPGFIKKICFEEYQQVRKGDTLVIIEDAEFRLRVAQAEADLANATAGRQATTIGIATTQNNLSVSDASIEEVRVQMENAQRELNRFEKLLQEDAVTKQQYDNVLLYVDEAHAVGVRGMHGLGCAEEQDCVADIDFLCGTFGKALASVGGYIVCSKTIRDYLVNKMRTFIFTTALSPVNLLWTFFILEHLNSFSFRRERLKKISSLLKDALVKKGYACPSTSHILPMTIGDSGDTVLKADFLQRKGFYALPVRPPTVPEGTSRIRFSLTADITEEEIKSLIELI